MIKQLLRFLIFLMIPILLFVFGIVLFKAVYLWYIMWVLPILVTYIFFKIDALICFITLWNKENNNIEIRTCRTCGFTFVSDYNLSGFSKIRVAKHYGYVGIPKTIANTFSKESRLYHLGITVDRMCSREPSKTQFYVSPSIVKEARRSLKEDEKLLKEHFKNRE